jgi:signal transduction histidine kinase
VTFQDVTDSVNVERALVERADALQDADRIKSQFVQHVSYELRTPLTNIIGFAHLLLDPAIGPTIGPTTEKQARLSLLDRQVLERAARDHQRHPRSDHYRRRRDAA